MKVAVESGPTYGVRPRLAIDDSFPAQEVSLGGPVC